MNRLTFRPRPLDVNKKLSIVRSIKELDSEDVGVSRTVHHGHIALDAENEEVLSAPAKKGGSEIPTPRYEVVESYVVNYTPTFRQPVSYIRSKPARSELSDYIEYDLDDEDDDWLELFNRDRKLLSPERFEWILYKLEVMDFKLREKSGIANLPFGEYTEICLTFDYAYENLKSQNIKHGVLLAAYNYWKEKRDRWGKPLLRRLQPAPSVNDTNPFHVFRPREKISRPNTRRMQRRENDYHSYEKLCQIRQNIQEAKELLILLQKREEKKRSLAECELKMEKMELSLNKESLKTDHLMTPHLPPLPSPKLQIKPSGEFPQIFPEKKKVNGFLTSEVKRKRSREFYNPASVSNHLKESQSLIKADTSKHDARAENVGFLKGHETQEHEEDELKDELTIKNLQLRKRKRRRNLLPPKATTFESFSSVPNLYLPASRPLPSSLSFLSCSTSAIPCPSSSEPPVFMPFTRPIDLNKLASFNIHLPQEKEKNIPCRARFGRGGRIVFDRYDCISRTPIQSITSSDKLQPDPKLTRQYTKSDSTLENFRNPPPPRIDNEMENDVHDVNE